MAVDLTDPKMAGFRPLEDFQKGDCDASSRRIREESKIRPLSQFEIEQLLLSKADKNQPIFTGLVNAANDTAAAALSVPVNGAYLNGSQLMVRRS